MSWPIQVTRAGGPRGPTCPVPPPPRSSRVDSGVHFPGGIGLVSWRHNAAVGAEMMVIVWRAG